MRSVMATRPASKVFACNETGNAPAVTSRASHCASFQSSSLDTMSNEMRSTTGRPTKPAGSVFQRFPAASTTVKMRPVTSSASRTEIGCDCWSVSWDDEGEFDSGEFTRGDFKWHAEVLGATAGETQLVDEFLRTFVLITQCANLISNRRRRGSFVPCG